MSRSPTAACQTTQLTARFVQSGETCFHVVDSFFTAMSASADGGAIYFTTAALIVSDSTFLETVAARNGGAIEDQGDVLSVSRCCFRSTQAASSGMAVDSVSGNVEKSVGESSFVGCASSSATVGLGTVYFADDSQADLTNINFTGCSLPQATDAGFGAAVFLARSEASFSCTFCTVFACGGVSCVHSFVETSVPVVSYCNFYGNALSQRQTSGVVYARTVGLRIEACIFQGNTKEIYQFNVAKSKFIVVDCVFSGNLPSGDFYDQATNNKFQTETASYTISVLATLYCPTASPSMSGQTRSPSQSSIPVATQTKGASPAETVSCVLYDGATAPISYSGGGCVIVTNSFFADTSEPQGGGISVNALSLTVADTTFLRTQANSGGAVQSDGGSLVASRCCFRETSGATGTAIAISGASSNEVSDSSFVSCSANLDGGTGTVFLYVGILNSVDLNFSQCDLRPTDAGNPALGAAVYASRDTARFQLQYSTVLKSSGMSCLQSMSVSVHSVLSCNFYGNLLAGSFAVLAADTVGMRVDSCIFNGNTVEIFLYHQIGGEARFTLLNSVFSGAFPAGAYYDSVSGNVVNSVTAPYTIGVYGTQFCPTSNQTASPVPPSNPPNVDTGVSPGVLYGVGAAAFVVVVGATIALVIFCRKRKYGERDELPYEVERESGGDFPGGADRFLSSIDANGPMDGHHPEAFSEAGGFRP
jgi:hypothetical protein